MWTLRAELPRDPNDSTKRRQKAITFRGTRDEAHDALHRFVLNVKAGPTYDSQITLDSLYEMWKVADSSRQKERAVTTTQHDRLRYERWLRPYFGNRIVTTLRPIEIENFYERLRRSQADSSPGLSPNSVVRVHALLAAMTNWGFRKELINKNPLDHVTKPRGQLLPPRAPTEHEVKALLEHLWVKDRQLWLAVRLASTLGLRRSELLAVKWEDLMNVVVSETGYLRVSSGIVADPTTKKLITTDTKGGVRSHRQLWLDEQLTDDIREMFIAFSVDKIRNGYVFSSSKDFHKPWYPDTLSKKLSDARDEIANEFLSSSPPVTFRSLRIFCASVIFANELDVRTAKAVLGHASLQTTDRYYIAFNDEQHREATVGVGNKLSRSPLDGVRY